MMAQMRGSRLCSPCRPVTPCCATQAARPTHREHGGRVAAGCQDRGPASRRQRRRLHRRPAALNPPDAGAARRLTEPQRDRPPEHVRLLDAEAACAAQALSRAVEPSHCGRPSVPTPISLLVRAQMEAGWCCTTKLPRSLVATTCIYASSRCQLRVFIVHSAHPQLRCHTHELGSEHPGLFLFSTPSSRPCQWLAILQQRLG